MLDPAHQLTLRERPDGQPAMRQSWRDLSFLHFAVEPELVQPFLPESLHVDTFPDDQGREMAWIGLVPFWMDGVRWTRLGPVPGHATFPETNVRTYVHRDGRDPGVWFFSLDATKALVCAVARLTYSLPYFPAALSVERDGLAVSYRGRRRAWGERAEYRVEVEAEPDSFLAEPGSLEFFLVERYLLYSRRGGGLFTGRVHHPPYLLQPARAPLIEESMVEAAGLPSRSFSHVMFSPGVDVEVFGLRRLA